MVIYQHYREEEHLFVDQILSLKEQVKRNFIPRITDFLNPREQQILRQLIGEKNEELKVKFFGGKSYTERNRAIIAPFYEEISEKDFELSLLESTYAKKFMNLTHRDALGAFVSLGIERKKLGDIYVGDGKIQMIVSQDIAPFVLVNLTRIKRANVQFQTVSLDQFLLEEPKWETFERTVSSLRLDAVITAIHNLSRRKATELIKHKRVQVNHKIIEDAAYIIEPEDLISVRGKGRSKFISQNGLSRKGRYRITVAILR